jgi:Uma2 family endonuclease
MDSTSDRVAQPVKSTVTPFCEGGLAMIAQTPTLTVTWEKLPDDYVLPDDPVDNINQPALAAALTESLQLANRLGETSITFTNYGICATVNGKIVVKAPDWGYVSSIRVPREEVARSYTPELQGEIPTIVMEFLSETEGTEYSNKPTYPPGKWFYYEQVLRVPNYAIFELKTGALEFYRLDESGRYHLETPDEHQRYWIPEMNLALGVWEGTRENRIGVWLRWWDEAGNLLLWGNELIEQERQRSQRLAEKLRELGLDPEQL